MKRTNIYWKSEKTNPEKKYTWDNPNSNNDSNKFENDESESPWKSYKKTNSISNRVEDSKTSSKNVKNESYSIGNWKNYRSENKKTENKFKDKQGNTNDGSLSFSWESLNKNKETTKITSRTNSTNQENSQFRWNDFQHKNERNSFSPTSRSRSSPYWPDKKQNDFDDDKEDEYINENHSDINDDENDSSIDDDQNDNSDFDSHKVRDYSDDDFNATDSNPSPPSKSKADQESESWSLDRRPKLSGDWTFRTNMYGGGYIIYNTPRRKEDGKRSRFKFKA